MSSKLQGKPLALKRHFKTENSSLFFYIFSFLDSDHDSQDLNPVESIYGSEKPLSFMIWGYPFENQL
jgi:hypothetical protein